MDFIRRYRLLLGILSFVFMVLPGAIESAWSLAERISGENIVMPEISVIWFTYFTVPIGLIMLGIIIFQGRISKITKQGDSLQIEVQSCVIHDWIPQSKLEMLKHMSTVEVEAKFCPRGKIKLHSLELHMGRHIFDAKRLPVIAVDREDTYFISFEVPSWVFTEYVKRRSKTYIRVLTEDRDWCSNEFTIAVASTVKLRTTEEERQRQNKLLVKLHQEYILSHDGISPRMMAGTAPLPKEWVEKRLEEMGETWRRDKYYP